MSKFEQTKSCDYCPATLRFIYRKDTRKFAPVVAEPVRRNGSDPLPSGFYFDRFGTRYKQDAAPMGVDLWMSHWADCPGRDQARKGGTTA